MYGLRPAIPVFISLFITSQCILHVPKMHPAMACDAAQAIEAMKCGEFMQCVTDAARLQLPPLLPSRMESHKSHKVAHSCKDQTYVCPTSSPSAVPDSTTLGPAMHSNASTKLCAFVAWASVSCCKMCFKRLEVFRLLLLSRQQALSCQLRLPRRCNKPAQAQSS